MNNTSGFRLDELLKYNKNPYYKNSDCHSIISNIKYSILSYLFCLLTVVSITFILLAVDRFLVDELNIPSIYNQIRGTNNGVKVYFGNYALLIVVIVVPFIEESIFRLPLNAKRISTAISVAILFFRLLGNSLTHIEYTSKHYWFSVLGSLSILFAVYKCLPIVFEEKIKYKYFKTWYFSIAIFFGLAHLFNIKDINMKNFIFCPLFVMPQIAMGFFLNNIRMQRGFLWAVVLHGMINSTSFLVR